MIAGFQCRRATAVAMVHEHLEFRIGEAVEVGAHARSAVGMAELPFNIPVEIEGELEIHA